MCLRTADGDALATNYVILHTADNYLKNTCFDTTEIRGEFAVTYVKSSPSLAGDDTMRVSKKTFSTQIIIGKELQ